MTVESKQHLKKNFQPKIAAHSKKIILKANNISLRMKILSLIMLTVIVLTSANILYYFNVVRPAEIETRTDHMTNSITFLEKRMQDFMSQKTNVLSLLAKSNAIIGYGINTSNQNLKNSSINEIKSIAKSQPEIIEASFLDFISGKELFKLRLNDQTKQLTPVRQDQLLINLSTANFFVQTKLLGIEKVYISPIQEDPVTNLPIILMATIIGSVENNVNVGVLLFKVEVASFMQNFVRFIESITTPSTEVVLALEDQSVIFAGTNAHSTWYLKKSDNNTISSVFPDLPPNFISMQGSNNVKKYMTSKFLGTFGGNVYTTKHLNVTFTDPNYKLHAIISTPVSEIMEDLNNQLIVTTIFAILIAIIISLLAVVLVHAFIQKPLNELMSATREIAKGNLHVSIQVEDERTDEIGQLAKQFKDMKSSLQSLIEAIRNSNEIVSSSAEEISSQTEEVTASAEEVSTSIQQIARHSSTQAEMLSVISEELDRLNTTVEDITKQIHDNVNKITEISQLTRILSLNATIEAARSEQGNSGFMVIAENIQQLAAETKTAVTIISKVSKTMTESFSKSFKEITDKISEIAALSEESAATSEEVAASISEVISAMEELTATAQVLTEQVEKTSELLHNFQL